MRSSIYCSQTIANVPFYIQWTILELYYYIRIIISGSINITIIN